ncbi:hypothetical protein J4771_05070 [Candidatus Kaistella beijingensis]|uniref:hypothetical protein n=1 Tax=Candidatus Kaistella beijingensis TaxID=2820270 RepID=UPI001CC64FB5|nr:hypothetical protein [Candidatus Kaistella beijingensis]UBB90720.1 hypothetical protein J4771_05070 [Candidatus Kaistella beijingensis]
MKSLHEIIFALLFTLSLRIHAQVINWENLPQNNIASVNFGTEYGIISGLTYGYKISDGKFPFLINTEVSIPFGEKRLDDFKVKLGGQIRVLKVNNFNMSIKMQGIFRVYNSDFVKISNFGSDFSTTIGYYRERWFTGAEFGFDKAIVSRYIHTDLYKSNFPDVKDGWYEPSTGGNYYYNVKGGYSFGENDITLSVGKITSQDFKTSPLFPIFSQIGYNIKF